MIACILLLFNVSGVSLLPAMPHGPLLLGSTLCVFCSSGASGVSMRETCTQSIVCVMLFILLFFCCSKVLSLLSIHIISDCTIACINKQPRLSCSGDCSGSNMLFYVSLVPLVVSPVPLVSFLSPAPIKVTCPTLNPTLNPEPWTPYAALQ